MIPINSTYAPIQAFVDELARCGMRHAVTCPGSRNAPIALTLAAHAGIEAVSVLDERSAGFLALGIAKESPDHPVAITTTSGTAAANLLPAVVEAREAGVPLIVLTADRPPELREVGAGQAIDQIKLFGSFAKWFAEVGNHEPGRASAVHHRQLACRAFSRAAEGRPGPVHLNFPLREPLAPVRDEALDATDWQGRGDGEPWTDVRADPAASPVLAEQFARLLDSAATGVVVCGEGAGPGAAQLAWQLRWPLLAEPTSGARCGPDARDNVIAHYDVLLRDEGFAAARRPELVVRVGEMPTSKPLRAWVAGCRQAVLDPWLEWHDPTRGADTLWAADPWALCLDAADLLQTRRDDKWLEGWRAADALVLPALEATDEPFEPKAYNVLADIAQTVWVSSSMPIRDIESYFPRTERHIRFLSNRGANGIDGVVSSAAGAAIGSGAPVHLVIGELALLHDVGGLISARRAGAQLAVLCVNNGGGAIFDFLPVAQAAHPAHYEEHIATPVDADIASIAALGGLEHSVAASAADVREQLRPGTLVELRVDRAESLRRHREMVQRVTARLDAN